MNFIAWFLLALGIFLIYAGVKNKTIFQLIREAVS